jgi:hypothetical protein
MLWLEPTEEATAERHRRLKFFRMHGPAHLEIDMGKLLPIVGEAACGVSHYCLFLAAAGEEGRTSAHGSDFFFLR